MCELLFYDQELVTWQSRYSSTTYIVDIALVGSIIVCMYLSIFTEELIMIDDDDDDDGDDDDDDDSGSGNAICSLWTCF